MKRLLLAITLLASVSASAAAAVPQTEDVVAFAASGGGTGLPVIPVASDYHFPGTAAATLTVRATGTGATSPVLAFRNSGNNQPGYVILSPNGGLVSGFPGTSAGFTGTGYLRAKITQP